MRAVVTGANRGIGLALRTALEARGDTVFGTRRDADAGAPGWLRLDVADPASCRAMAQAYGSGPLDLLVCNAGIYPDSRETLEEGFPAAMWAETFAVNVTGVFLTVQALLANLRAARAGKIAIIASQLGSSTRAGDWSTPGSYIYRSSKAAAINLGRNLAADLAPEGIAVGIYHPGWVRTDMGGKAGEISAEAAAEGLVARIDALSPATSGVFETWDGRAHPF